MANLILVSHGDFLASRILLSQSIYFLANLMRLSHFLANRILVSQLFLANRILDSQPDFLANRIRLSHGFFLANRILLSHPRLANLVNSSEK